MRARLERREQHCRKQDGKNRLHDSSFRRAAGRIPGKVKNRGSVR
jgi:hypothetical protein